MPKKGFNPDILDFDPLTVQLEQRKKKYANPKKNELLKKKGFKKDLRQTDLKIYGDEYFFNYELSWLKFNWRVLAEAQNKKTPLLERVKFIGIVCSNLDEFFQKRVGGLKRQLHAGVVDLSLDGKTPEEQLKLIRKDVQRMINTYRNCFFKDLVPELENEGIVFRKYVDMSDEERKIADDYFEKQLYPIITPLAVDEAHPFPFISNKSRSLAVKLLHPKTGEILFARVKIPSNRPRWIELSKGDGRVVLASLSDLIRKKIDRFFPGMKLLSAHIFRVTRNADLERNEEEADDLLELIEDELRERRFADTVRLEIDAKTPKDVKTYLMNHLGVDKSDMFEMKGPLGLADSIQLYSLSGYDHLKYKPWVPTLHPVFLHPPDEEAPHIFETIRNGDFLVHHPYHSFKSSTQRFVETAANDPKVLAIKQTLYRTSSDSPLMHALMKAADSGKQVAVLVELKARFDEERNIGWAQKLEKAGVHVSYGMAGLKIHSKLTMVVREEKGELKRYMHIGTGNYHPDTAQLYEDFGLFTTDSDIASDVSDVFNLLTGYAPDQEYDKLLVAPDFLRNRMTEMIDFEIKEASEGRKGRIIAKINNLEDPLIIQKLYEASSAGVQIDLIVRSVCLLIPNKPGVSENIRVHSVIGRYLEHSRCFYFHAGGKDLYFIGSADWMHRNLDARVEVVAPVEGEELKSYMQFVFSVYLRDNQQRWTLGQAGRYRRVTKKKGEVKVSTHDVLMNHAHEHLLPIPAETLKG